MMSALPDILECRSLAWIGKESHSQGRKLKLWVTAVILVNSVFYWEAKFHCLSRIYLCTRCYVFGPSQRHDTYLDGSSDVYDSSCETSPRRLGSSSLRLYSRTIIITHLSPSGVSQLSLCVPDYTGSFHVLWNRPQLSMYEGLTEETCRRDWWYVWKLPSNGDILAGDVRKTKKSVRWSGRIGLGDQVMARAVEVRNCAVLCYGGVGTLSLQINLKNVHPFRKTWPRDSVPSS